MANKISLIILKTHTGFEKIYHKKLVDAKMAKESRLSSPFWSHPVILRSYRYKIGMAYYTLNDLLDKRQGSWYNEYKTSAETYPHIRLEITHQDSSDPLSDNIPKDKFLSGLIFTYDNAGMNFVKAGAATNNGGYSGYDDDAMYTMVRAGRIPTQPWGQVLQKNIEKSVLKDIIEMKAGTWVNNPISLKNIPSFVLPLNWNKDYQNIEKKIVNADNLRLTIAGPNVFVRDNKDPKVSGNYAIAICGKDEFVLNTECLNLANNEYIAVYRDGKRIHTQGVYSGSTAMLPAFDPTPDYSISWTQIKEPPDEFVKKCIAIRDNQPVK